MPFIFIISYCENEKKREKVRGEGGGGQSSQVGGGVQGGCEWRSEAFVKSQFLFFFFFFFFFLGGGGAGGVMEVSGRGGGGGGVRVDVNIEK